MRDFYLVLVVAVIFATLSQSDSFLLGNKKDKNGCNPDPCKNKAQCVLDPKDSNKHTCNCLTGYYGQNCENKDGCHAKPCKHGECIVNATNRADFTCKCIVSYVGKKCDTKNECGVNPCKNDGVCSLDKNNKAQCTCKPGFTSKYCDKRNCTVVQFKGKHFEKLPKVYIDKEMEPKFKALDALAKTCKVIIQPVKSFIQQTNPKVTLVDPIYAPHYIGRALSFELLDQKGKLYCNSICLGKNPIPQPNAKCFIEGAVKQGWKWDNKKDPSQIHDGTYGGNQVTYNTLREAAQVGCKDENF